MTGESGQDGDRRFYPQRLVVFVLIAVTGVAIDLATKSWIFNRLWHTTPPSPRQIWIWDGHFGWEVSLNEGALFGIGQGMIWLFVSLSGLAAIGIVYWLFVLGEARSLWLTIALAGITAGIFGNLYDRLGMHQLTWPPGYAGHQVGEPVYAVRDWILVQWNDQWKWPNFNIADSLLVSGAIMLFAHALWSPAPPEKVPAKSQKSG